MAKGLKPCKYVVTEYGNIMCNAGERRVSCNGAFLGCEGYEERRELVVKRCVFASMSNLSGITRNGTTLNGVVHCGLLGGVCKAMSIGCYNYEEEK